MEDWKVRQRLYKLFANKTDSISCPSVSVLNTGDLVDGIANQFADADNVVYPYKSYCVALVYALCLSSKYGNNLEYYLEQDILPDDPCFKKYSEAKAIYDTFLSTTSWANSPMGIKIQEYWEDEYCSEITYEDN